LAYTVSVTVGDFNGGGNPDLAVADWGNTGVTAFDQHHAMATVRRAAY
jgi:hypothetical protein